jgi:hypothetical protein
VIRGAFIALLLGGCALVEHVQVFPPFDKNAMPECCVAVFVEDPPARYSLTVTHPPKGVQAKATAALKF